MNPYESIINTYLGRILELRHGGNYINLLVQNRILDIQKNNLRVFHGSALALSDWTGPGDVSDQDIILGDALIPKGTHWVNNYTTSQRSVYNRENISQELEKLTSNYFQYIYVQCYEALETLTKELVWKTIEHDETFLHKVKLKDLFRDGKIERSKLRGGSDIFNLIKKVCSESLPILDLHDIWSVLSDCRNSITHSKSLLALEKNLKTQKRRRLFENLFESIELSEERIEIKLTYSLLDRLIKTLAEFAFQLYKAYSLKYNYPWQQVLLHYKT